MKFAIILFFIGIAYISIRSVSTDCPAVKDICTWWQGGQFANLNLCLLNLSQNKSIDGKFTSTIKNIYDLLNNAQQLNCATLSNAITAKDACNWFNSIPGWVTNIVQNVGQLINDLVKKGDCNLLCFVLSCVLDTVFTFIFLPVMSCH